VPLGPLGPLVVLALPPVHSQSQRWLWCCQQGANEKEMKRIARIKRVHKSSQIIQHEKNMEKT
jgi:hypothetical protein